MAEEKGQLDSESGDLGSGPNLVSRPLCECGKSFGLFGISLHVC